MEEVANINRILVGNPKQKRTPWNKTCVEKMKNKNFV
jgi:hypothetical protein